jgi:hypothetical protein
VIALTARIVDAEIMLSVLIEILGRDPIVPRRRFARQGKVTFVYLKGVAANTSAEPVAIETLIVLPNLRLLLEPSVWIKATARLLV